MTSEIIACASGTVANDSCLFEGTSVPFKELHDHMREDWNLYGFLGKFPSVGREQALEELEKATRRIAKRIIDSHQNGELVFERTEVPVKRVFDYLASGRSLKDFHWDFVSVFVEDTWDAVVTSGRILEVDAYRGLGSEIIRSHRAYVSGTPVFTGTLLPIRILFDCLADGQTLKDFYYQYSSATPDRLVEVVKAAGKALEREAREAAT